MVNGEASITVGREFTVPSLPVEDLDRRALGSRRNDQHALRCQCLMIQPTRMCVLHSLGNLTNQCQSPAEIHTRQSMLQEEVESLGISWMFEDKCRSALMLRES